MMTVTLITGANKGLGYEAARRLIDLGHAVLAGARDPQRGTEAARELGAAFILIDPTDDDSVEVAAARVRDEYGHLDVLINNAGTAAPRLGAEELTAEAAMEGFAINAARAVRPLPGPASRRQPCGTRRYWRRPRSSPGTRTPVPLTTPPDGSSA